MSYTEKTTSRFTFGISRNQTAKKAGSNNFSITTNPYDGKYSMGTTTLTMSLKEATALRNFLNSNIDTGSSVEISS